MASSKLPKVSSSTSSNATNRKLNGKVKIEHICPICEDPILDAKGRRKGKDASFCDGTCQAWLHRRCAGPSRAAFEAKISCNAAFYCPSCRLSNLEQTVADMKKELTAIKSMAAANSTGPICLKQTISSKLYSSAVSGTVQSQPPLNNFNGNGPKPPPESSDINRKYNLKVFGISESQQRTPPLARRLNDLKAIKSIFTDLEEGSGHTSTICDCHRTGRYVPNKEKPRPILVCCYSTMDVTNVLSRRNSLQKPISTREKVSVKLHFT